MTSQNLWPAVGEADGAVNSMSRHGFKITTRKAPILKAGPLEEMNQKLGITVPEMIFGDNYARIEHEASGWAIEFNTFDALDRVDKTGDNMLKVSYSNEWQKNREHHTSSIKEVIKPFDWSYTTDYSGTTSAESPSFAPTETPIPLELLKRPDPILFFEDVPLYEDELADNGIALLSIKIRVMPERLLLLARFFMRLDGVLFRIRDTRVFVEFETSQVIREYTAREEKYEDVRKTVAGRREDGLAIMRDPNQLATLLPVVEMKRDGLVLK